MLISHCVFLHVYAYIYHYTAILVIIFYNLLYRKLISNMAYIYLSKRDKRPCGCAGKYLSIKTDITLASINHCNT